MRKLAVAGLLLLSAVSGSIANSAEITYAGCTITGDNRNNLIRGTSGDDVICSLGGNDIIYGMGGDDLIYSGLGNDYVEGGDGKDTIHAGGGDDSIYGNAGSDSLWGEGGADGLNGGTALDLLRGGTGADTCFSFKSDNYLSNDCFFDKAAPKLHSIAFSSPNLKIDSTKSATSLEVQFKISDASGFKSLDILLSNTSNPDSDNALVSLNFVNTNRDCGKVSEEFPVPVTEDCRISGTNNNGIYKARLNLPQILSKGNYKVTELWLEDIALNRAYFESPAIERANQGLSFTQTGIPDGKPPVLIGARIIGSNVVQSELDRLIARVSFDDVGGHGIRNFSVNYKTPETFFTSGSFSQWADASALMPCTEQHHIDTTCLYSGTPSKGVIQFSLNADSRLNDIRALNRAQPLVPDSYSISDSLGNQYGGDLPEKLVEALTFFKGFSSPSKADDKDVKAPILVSLTLDKRSVSTAISAQDITVTARIKDSGVGVNRFIDSTRLEMNLEGGGGVFCTPKGFASGTAKDATFVFTCTLPAHAAEGLYELWLSSEDMSLRENRSEYSPTKLRALKLRDSIING
jgi:hypothetical protein